MPSLVALHQALTLSFASLRVEGSLLIAVNAGSVSEVD